MKKIWLWNHYAINMAINEGGRHYWFAQELINRGYSTTIFCANIYGGGNKSIELNGKKYKVRDTNGIPFVYVQASPYTNNGFARVKNMISFYKNLFPATKKYVELHGKPDIIIASSVHPLTMLAGIQIAKKLRIPCICEVRDLWPEAIFAFGKAKETSLLGRILLQGERWIYKNSDALIFTKEGDVDYIIERKWDTTQGGDIDLSKCHYINNGLDLVSFQELIKQNKFKDDDLETDKFNVVYTGAIRPVNNVGNILDAAKFLQDDKDIQFLIYGSGSEEDKLRERIEDEKITNVKLKGRVEKKKIPYILSKSSVNLLNYSNNYNWTRGNSSNKLFEYMASGKPTISTVKMGYCILDKYQCGLSLDENTPAELAKTVLKIKNMPKDKYEAMGENAQKGAQDFDFNVLTGKLIDVIESL